MLTYRGVGLIALVVCSVWIGWVIERSSRCPRLRDVRVVSPSLESAPEEEAPTSESEGLPTHATHAPLDTRDYGSWFLYPHDRLEREQCRHNASGGTCRWFAIPPQLQKRRCIGICTVPSKELFAVTHNPSLLLTHGAVFREAAGGSGTSGNATPTTAAAAAQYVDPLQCMVDGNVSLMVIGNSHQRHMAVMLCAALGGGTGCDAISHWGIRAQFPWEQSSAQNLTGFLRKTHTRLITSPAFPALDRRQMSITACFYNWKACLQSFFVAYKDDSPRNYNVVLFSRGMWDIIFADRRTDALVEKQKWAYAAVFEQFYSPTKPGAFSSPPLFVLQLLNCPQRVTKPVQCRIERSRVEIIRLVQVCAAHRAAQQYPGVSVLKFDAWNETCALEKWPLFDVNGAPLPDKAGRAPIAGDGHHLRDTAVHAVMNKFLRQFACPESADDLKKHLLTEEEGEAACALVERGHPKYRPKLDCSCLTRLGNGKRCKSIRTLFGQMLGGVII